MPICVISVGLGYGLGVGPVLFALLGEILPQRIKSLACSIILSGRNMVTFLNLKIFPAAVSIMGLHALFWIHATLCIVIGIFAYFLLPETQGKTLTELSVLYERKRRPSVSKPVVLTKEQEANKGIRI